MLCLQGFVERQDPFFSLDLHYALVPNATFPDASCLLYAMLPLPFTAYDRITYHQMPQALCTPD